MTTEQLLRSRYKIISDYPGSIFEVGQIVEKHLYANGKQYIPNLLQDPDNYPAIFQRLTWWQHRRPDQMPEYVKCVATPDQIIQPGDVLKVTWHGLIEVQGRTEDGKWIFPYTNCFEPATEADYNAWKKDGENE
jgi:hypothetical protein